MSVRITYDTKTVEVLIDNDALLTRYFQEREQHRSSSGKTETVNQYGIQEMSFASLFDESTYEDLLGWWSWARQGELWSFVWDSAKVGSTTLVDAAAAGQTTIAVDDNNLFSDQDVCLLYSANDDKFEIVVLSNASGSGAFYLVDESGDFVVDEGGNFIVAGGGFDTFVTAENLKFSYVTGDIIRHLNYWPNVISLDAKFEPKRESNYYKHTFKFANLN